ncbi:MAG TPA: vitamin K epoxide reductase family protein, partial [Mucilaginibacter sp.]
MKNQLSKLLEPKINGPEITSLLVELLNVKISESTIKKELEQHPDYPSLLSISDVLKSYGIENIGIKFNHNKFTEIPVPFITQFKSVERGIQFFTVVKDIKENIIHFLDPEKHSWRVLAKDDFLKRCSGVALLTEAGDDAGEKNYVKIRKEEKRKNVLQYFAILFIPVAVVIAGIIALLQYGTSTLLPFVFSIFTLAGGVVGALLLWYELDQHNPVLQQICNAGKKVNCSAVLQSKASKVAGVSWSSIGFSYFMGMLLLFLFFGITSPVVLSAVSWINAIAVPYVLFSLYYQWHVAKQWCVLCLSAQGLLVLQLTTALLGGWYTLLPFGAIRDELFSPTTLTAFVIPFIITAILVPSLQKAKEGKRYYTELQKLKHNRQIFEALLQKQKEVTENPQGLGIILGNPNAPYKLIKVCNPYCGPCAKAHTPMEELLHNNSDVQLQILFTATNTEGDIKTPPVKHLLAIAANNTEAIVKQALDNWYFAEKKDYETFATKYPMNGELKQQEAKIGAMKNWCDKTTIAFTPTFFVSIPNHDGFTRYYQLPEIYSVADLKY